MNIENIPVIMTDDSQPEPWWAASLRAFKSSLGRRNYPCHFGRVALERGEIFATFFDASVAPLADALTEFLDMSRQYLDRRMVLAAFRKSDGGVSDERSYADQFWQVLQGLHDADSAAWPADLPSCTDEPAWEYSFHGVPMFVFAAAPSYQRRASRNLGPGLVLLFQPRNVFTGIEGGTPRGARARQVIRQRLRKWDTVPPHPDLLDYGDPANHEWRQYFFPDDQTRMHERCPLHIRQLDAASDRLPDHDRQASRQ